MQYLFPYIITTKDSKIDAFLFCPHMVVEFSNLFIIFLNSLSTMARLMPFSVYAREEWLLQIIDMSFHKILLCKNDFIVNLSAFNDLQPMQRRRIIFHKDIYKWCIWSNDLLNCIIVVLHWYLIEINGIFVII